MLLKRPLFLLAAAFILGALSMLPECGPHIRSLSFLSFCLLFYILLLPRTPFAAPFPRLRASFLFFLILLFLIGQLCAASVAREFQSAESAAFFASHAPRNEGEFDYSLYLKSNGVQSDAALKRFRQGGLLASEHPFFALLSAFKKRCTDILSETLSEKDAGVYRALLLGDRSALDERLRLLYQSQGIAHLLAVSGLHLSILGMGFFRLLRKLGVSLFLSGLTASALILCYGVLIGAQGSAGRAILMLLIRFLSLYLGRSCDTLSALSAAALLLLLRQPYLLLQSGFQLSFGAILGISLLGEALISFLETAREAARLTAARAAGYESISAARHESISAAGDEGINAAGQKVRQAAAQKIRQTAKQRSHSPNPLQAPLRISDGSRLSSFSKTLLISLSIQLFTLPILLFQFFSFPLYSVFLNLLVIPLMVFVLVSGLAVLFFGLAAELTADAAPIPAGIFRFLSEASAGGGHYILRLYELLCRRTAELPFSVLMPGRPEAYRILLYYGLMAFFFVLFCKFPAPAQAPGIFRSGKDARFFKNFPPKHSARRRMLLPGAAELRLFLFFLSLAASAAVFIRTGPQRLTVKAIDVGQGDGFLIRYQDRAVLIDAGSSSEKELGAYTLRPFLLSQGITKLDAVYVSHNDLDHTSGIRYLLSELPEVRVEKLILPKAAAHDPAYRELSESGLHAAGGVHFLSHGDTFFFSDEIMLRCVYEGRPASPEANAHSPALLLEYKNFRMLFTGDMTKGDEALLAKSLTASENLPFSIPLTVYKAAHHGSKTSNSDAILKRLWPRYALISSGRKNRYGHPHKEVTERFLRYGSTLLQTAVSGEIILSTDGARLWIKRFSEA